jgi:methionyl-tRNA formyltransferase
MATRPDLPKYAKAVLIGTGKLPAMILELLASYFDNLLVIEPEVNPFSPLEGACIRNNVPYICEEDRNSISNHLQTFSSEATLVVSAYNGFIFPDELVFNDRITIINFHNSFLPKNRGRNAPTWAIFKGDTVTGITWHQVTGKLDFGSYYLSQELEIDEEITAGELTSRTLQLGASTFKALFPRLAQKGLVDFRTMDAINIEVPNKSSKIPNNGHLDLTWNAVQVSRYLRSLDYGPFRVFPKSKVILEGTAWTVESYALNSDKANKKTESTSGESRVVSVSDGKLTIEIELSAI